MSRTSPVLLADAQYVVVLSDDTELTFDALWGADGSIALVEQPQAGGYAAFLSDLREQAAKKGLSVTQISISLEDRPEVVSDVQPDANVGVSADVEGVRSYFKEQASIEAAATPAKRPRR